MGRFLADIGNRWFQSETTLPLNACRVPWADSLIFKTTDDIKREEILIRDDEAYPTLDHYWKLVMRSGTRTGNYIGSAQGVWIT